LLSSGFDRNVSGAEFCERDLCPINLCSHFYISAYLWYTLSL
jgi:hypothetical protein